MAFPFSPARLAGAAARRPWRVVTLWALLMLAGAVLSVTVLPGVLTTQFKFIGNPDSKVGDDLLTQRLRGPRHAREVVIVRSQTRTVDEPEFRAFVEQLSAAIDGVTPSIVLPGSLTSYYRSGDQSLVSSDRRTTILPLELAGDLDDADKHVDPFRAAVKSVSPPAGLEILHVGFATVGADVNKQSAEDLRKGETVGIAIALVILVLVFGTLVAALIPVIVAAGSIVIALGVAALVGQFGDLIFFVTNMITMIGLAVGIDYSLLTVQRYREERGQGLGKLEAIERAGATASRTVLFSGMTVVLALIGMLLIPSSVFIAIGLGAILVTMVAMATALTLVPAILSLLGDRIDKGRIRIIGRAQAAHDEQRPGGFWDRISHTVMARPLVSLLLAGSVMLAAAIPFFSIETGFAGVNDLPDGLEAKRAFLILDREFSAGEVSPAEIVIDGPIDQPATQAAIERLKGLLGADPAFRAPDSLVVNQGRDLALLTIPVNGDAVQTAALDAVKRLRTQYVPEAFAGAPAKAYVTGDTAFNQDFFDLARNSAPKVFIFVLALSFVLLTTVFRSIVVAFKSILLNLLSVGAAYGLLVAVFQKGWGNEVLGFQQVDTIEAWLPLFLFSVLFGLSMDYHVFLLSRIRERYDQTRNNRESVAFGLRSTGRLITGASLIMVAVFGGFATSQLVSFQQFGFGLGIAVLLDASVIRMVLVPAAMALLGNANWYFPNWLRWLPDVRPHLEAPRQRAKAPATE